MFCNTLLNKLFAIAVTFLLGIDVTCLLLGFVAHPLENHNVRIYIYIMIS